jgi:integration host factor subunit alpha
MTKADVIEKVYDYVPGLSNKEAGQMVESVLITMKDILSEGENIKISGFGNFILRDKKSRPGRNPKTGDGITISARRVLTFRPSQVLKEKINK